MIKSIDAEVDEAGVLHPLEPEVELPRGRVRLSWEAGPDHSGYLLSEAALAKHWDSPEEDEAWAYLQPAK